MAQTMHVQFCGFFSFRAEMNFLQVLATILKGLTFSSCSFECTHDVSRKLIRCSWLVVASFTRQQLTVWESINIADMKVYTTNVATTSTNAAISYKYACPYTKRIFRRYIFTAVSGIFEGKVDIFAKIYCSQLSAKHLVKHSYNINLNSGYD